MTQGLIALVAFPEDLSFIASTHMAAYNFCNSNPRESDGVLTYIQEKYSYTYIYIYLQIFKNLGYLKYFFKVHC